MQLLPLIMKKLGKANLTEVTDKINSMYKIYYQTLWPMPQSGMTFGNIKIIHMKNSNIYIILFGYLKGNFSIPDTLDVQVLGEKSHCSIDHMPPNSFIYFKCEN